MTRGEHIKEKLRQVLEANKEPMSEELRDAIIKVFETPLGFGICSSLFQIIMSEDENYFYRVMANVGNLNHVLLEIKVHPGERMPDEKVN